MKRLIGFSTGSLAPGDIRRAVGMVLPHRTPAIELSALRASELDEAIEVALASDWSAFRYVSFHAPSRFIDVGEREVIAKLAPIINKGWPIIVHPDAISDWDAWRALGSVVTVENMDGRKAGGRTVEELEPIFERLPEARFCFDIGHAEQVDSSLGVAHELVEALGDRLVEVHLSIVDGDGGHQPLTAGRMDRFGPVLERIQSDAAIILETPVVAGAMGEQIKLATW